MDGPGLATLKLEGSIVADWVALLEDECLCALRDTRTLVLDLSAVTFVDRAGATMLRSIARENLEIVHASPLVAELLRAGVDQ